MEWIVWIFIVYFLCFCSYPDRVKKLEKKVNKLDKNNKGVCEMSKIITSLIGKNCKIRTEDALTFGNVEMDCSVLDADSEWIKLSYIDKKGITKIKILRIEAISNIEIISE